MSRPLLWVGSGFPKGDVANHYGGMGVKHDCSPQVVGAGELGRMWVREEGLICSLFIPLLLFSADQKMGVGPRAAPVPLHLEPVGSGCAESQAQRETIMTMCSFLLPAPAPCLLLPQIYSPLAGSRRWKE